MCIGTSWWWPRLFHQLSAYIPTSRPTRILHGLPPRLRPPTPHIRTTSLTALAIYAGLLVSWIDNHADDANQR
ncbi:hypothetical protein P691DRAFT_804255 [Macrolepiota fuliginosa MF-IS2]|uniref:Uncharacterized protein n=1 Tax=Macrolepiota fuliginosa MF-IS2 TaxID=1400762 RepID=A0A9P5XKG4_9AGAR|nr:hypothetical protein P691DRAFT_804255 [Macrolepiota fuliginosa MF-IS2]